MVVSGICNIYDGREQAIYMMRIQDGVGVCGMQARVKCRWSLGWWSLS